MKFSVVVATRNRCHKLDACIRAVSEAAKAVNAEFIIVDNASTDDTRAVVARFVGQGLPVRYVFEPARGASRARNAGIAVATGDVIAITDDDCHPRADWLVSMERHFDDAPDLDVLGGRVELFDPQALPVSIRLHEQRIVMTRRTNIFNFIIGANMAFRREVVRDIGGFNPLLGPGTRCGPAEDPDFVYRAFRAGHTARFEPDVVVVHDHERTSPEDLAVIRDSYAKGRGAFYASRMLAGDVHGLRLLYWHVRATLSRSDQDGTRAPRLRHLRNVASGLAAMAASKILGEPADPPGQPSTRSE